MSRKQVFELARTKIIHVVVVQKTTLEVCNFGRDLIDVKILKGLILLLFFIKNRIVKKFPIRLL